MVIGTNLSAQRSALLLSQSSERLNQSLARLSSGSKFISAADDPAGLATSISLGAQVGEINAATSNLTNALSFAQTQNGYLQQIGSALDQMATLAVSAQDGTKTDAERADYQKQFAALSAYITDAATKNFNGVSLFSSSALNVVTDVAGGILQMAGVSASYIGGTTTNTTSTATLGYSGDTALDQISSAFNATNGDTINVSYDQQGGTSDSNREFYGSNTLNELVSYFNSTGNSSATYNASTGQLSITANQDYYIQDHAEDGQTEAAGEPMLQALGLSPLISPQNTTDDVHTDANNITYPVTINATLTHSVTTPSTSGGTPDVSTVADAKAALTTINSAIAQLATDRATIGANTKRLNFSINELNTLQTNLSAANSRISDVDVAEESTNYAKQSILVQAGTAMLAQANASQKSILTLLGN